MISCRSCNFGNTEGTRFCVKCGTPIQAEASSQQPPGASDPATSSGSTISASDLHPTVFGSPQKTMLEDDPFPPVQPPSGAPGGAAGSAPDSASIPTILAPYTPASSPSGMTSGGGQSGAQSGGQGSSGSGSWPDAPAAGATSGAGSGQSATPPPGFGTFGNAPVASGSFGSQGGLPQPGGFSSSAMSGASSGNDISVAQSSTTQVNPPLAAIISFFFPGLGLLLVPNKLPLALGIFGGSMVLFIIIGIAAFFLSLALGQSGLCTLCIFPLGLLIQIGAAIFTYDEAAKLSNGQYKPLVFKK